VTAEQQKNYGGPRRRVYLMRHGEVDYFDGQGRPYRPEGVPLNAEGRAQAEAAARALAGVPLDRAVLLLCTLLGAGLGGLGALEKDAGCINLLEADDAGRCLVRLVNHTPADPLKAGLELSTLERLYRQYCQGREAPQG
jgi:hypothetical protein